MIDRAPKERGIICSAQQVRAILAGTKTQDRRIVKPQPTFIESSGRWRWPLSKRHDNGGKCPAVYTASREWWEYVPCEAYPYGQPGDRLLVRETWAWDDEDGARFYRADVGSGNEADDWERNRIDGAPRYRWRPSIHMPRWASRITLEITAVRVQRLQDIGHADAIAEGITGEELFRAQGYAPLAYRRLWESINCHDSWEQNPFVWVLSFRRLG
jgi:hypothetical protein